MLGSGDTVANKTMSLPSWEFAVSKDRYYNLFRIRPNTKKANTQNGMKVM